MQVLLLTLLALGVFLLLLLPSANAVTLSNADNDAKNEIITNMSNAVDHRYSQYDLITGSKIGDNSTFTIYNKTAENPIPPVVCGPGTELKDGVCVPTVPPPENVTKPENETTPTPTPTPEPTNATKITFGGDFSGSTVINSIKARNADLNIANGDLGYASDLSKFKAAWNQVPNHRCTVGNHDSPEDGNSAIFAESRAYCGDIWMQKVGGSTVVIGVNTNGNLQSQLQTAQQYLTSNEMVGVKNVILSSHKPCATPPNSHHVVESNVKAFCDSLKSKIPAGVNLYGVAAHNHVLSSSSDGHWFISGAGGRSHYTCGNGSGWDFCNNAKYGFLELIIKNGAITGTFYDTNGGVINQ